MQLDPSSDAFFTQPQGQRGDEALFVKFHVKSKLMKFKSEQAGRPIHEDREYIEIIVPGGKSAPDEEVNDGHRRRFARQYAAFKEGRELAESGTMLTQWPSIKAAQAEDLKHYKVFTVEQLAALSDHNLQGIGVMGLRELSEKARNYLAASKDTAAAMQLASENAELKATIERLASTVADLETKYKALAEKKTK